MKIEISKETLEGILKSLDSFYAEFNGDRIEDAADKEDEVVKEYYELKEAIKNGKI